MVWFCVRSFGEFIGVPVPMVPGHALEKISTEGLPRVRSFQFSVDKDSWNLHLRLIMSDVANPHTHIYIYILIFIFIFISHTCKYLYNYLPLFIIIYVCVFISTVICYTHVGPRKLS